MKKVLLAGLLAVGCGVLYPGIAGSSPTSGTETFQITQVNNQPGAVFAQGVFDAGGTNYPKTNTTDLFVFSNGAFLVHHPFTSQSGTFNANTCKFTFSFTGNFSLKGGVGAYKGISGSGTFSGSENGFAPRLPNGTCNMKQNAQPTASVTQVSATGTVSFG